MSPPTDADIKVLRQSGQNNGEPLSRFCWIIQSLHSAVHNVIEKLPVLRVLHYHEDGVRSLNDFIELSDGGVAYKFEYVEFACDSFDISDIFDFIFLQYFDGHGFGGVVVDGFLDFAERALADGRPS